MYGHKFSHPEALTGSLPMQRKSLRAKYIGTKSLRANFAGPVSLRADFIVYGQLNGRLELHGRSLRLTGRVHGLRAEFTAYGLSSRFTGGVRGLRAEFAAFKS